MPCFTPMLRFLRCPASPRVDVTMMRRLLIFILPFFATMPLYAAEAAADCRKIVRFSFRHSRHTLAAAHEAPPSCLMSRERTLPRIISPFIYYLPTMPVLRHDFRCASFSPDAAAMSPFFRCCDKESLCAMLSLPAATPALLMPLLRSLRLLILRHFLRYHDMIYIAPRRLSRCCSSMRMLPIFIDAR